MKKSIATEYAEQKCVIDWWSIYSRMKGLDERLLFASANAAKRSYKLAAMMKASGVRAGLPDLMLALPKFVRGVAPQAMMFAGLFIEMKRIGGKAEPHQIEYCDLLRRQGYNVVIAQGAEEAIRAIKGYTG